MPFLTDEEKQLLLDRYFDIEWCDDVSDLRCVRCHRVAIDHYVSSCQHLFCKTCSKFYGDEEHLRCPQCQEFISKPDNKDFELEVKIHLLKMFCPNKRCGCKHEDQLIKMPSHLLTCTDTRNAAHQMESQVKVTSLNSIIGELKQRIKDVNNKVEEKLDQVEKKTDDNYRKLNALTEGMTSLDKKVEGTVLETTKHAQELQSMKTRLVNINQRFEKNESLLQQTSNVEEMNIALNMDILQNRESEELNPLNARPYDIHLKVLAKNVQSGVRKYETKALMFAGHRQDIKVKIGKVREEEEEICISLQFKNGKAVNKFNQPNGITKVKYVVNDQSDAQNKNDITSELDLSFDDCFGNREWILAWVLPEAILAPPYMKDDCVDIDILFEPPSIDRSFVSNNGVLLWRVDNFLPKKIEYLYRREVHSPTFYTSPRGYRVRIRLVLNHSSKMSVEVNFLTGQHDAALTRHFPHMTTVTLINQTNPAKSLVKCNHSEYVKCHVIEFDTSRFVKKKGLKNGSLLVKVLIEPLVTSK